MSRRTRWMLLGAAVAGYLGLAWVLVQLGFAAMIIPVTVGGIATPFVARALARRRECQVCAAIARRASAGNQFQSS